MPRKTPVALTAMVVAQPSSVSSSDRRHAHDAGVVDEHVETAEALLRRAHGRLPVGQRGDVEAQEQRVVAVGPQLRARAPRRRPRARRRGSRRRLPARAGGRARRPGRGRRRRSARPCPRAVRHPWTGTGKPAGSGRAALRRTIRSRRRCVRSMSRCHSWRGMSIRDSAGDASPASPTAPAAVRNLRDEPRLGGVDGQLRPARGREPDEVQPLEPDRERHAGHAQRHAVGPLQQRGVEERERRP